MSMEVRLGLRSHLYFAAIRRTHRICHRIMEPASHINGIQAPGRIVFVSGGVCPPSPDPHPALMRIRVMRASEGGG